MKLTLTDVSDFRNQTVTANTLNSNNEAIETALENTLSRDGTSPNTMSADIDLNTNDLLNMGDIDASTGTIDTLDGTTATITTINTDSLWIDGVEVGVTVGADGAPGAAGQGVPVGGTAGQVLAKIDDTNYNTEWITSSALTDGDKGDIVVASSGASWTFETSVVTAAAKTVLDDATVGDMLTTLGGQPLDTELTALAGLTSAADKVPYFTGSGTAAVTDLTSAARSILDDTTVGAIRTTLGVGTADNPQFATIELGAASDTSLARVAAGRVSVEGVELQLQPTSNGLVTRTAAGTAVARTLTAPAAGITVTNGDGVSGNPTLVLANDLSALEGASGTNTIYYRSAADTWTAVTIGANVYFTGGTLKAYEVWGGAISDETTTITTGTGKLSFAIPYAFTVVGVYASLNTVSSSGTPTFDINEAGTTILSTKIVIDVSEKTGGSAGYQGTAAGAAVISDSSLAANAEITVDIDVAGTGAKGAKVFIIGYPT